MMADTAGEMPPITELSWADFEQHCVALADRLREAQRHFDAIVAIQRGGCVPAVLLAHLLQISEFLALGIRTTAHEAVRSARQAPVVTGGDILFAVKDKAVLIVDDVCNTGKTLEVAKEAVQAFRPKSVTTAVTIWDGDGEHPCAADFHGYFTPGWVVFPWERYER